MFESDSDGQDDEDHGYGYEDEIDSDGYEDEIDSDNDSDGEDEFPWLETISSTATMKSTDSTSAASEKQNIGVCLAQLIRRDRIRECFWESMEEPSLCCGRFAFRFKQSNGLHLCD